MGVLPIYEKKGRGLCPLPFFCFPLDFPKIEIKQHLFWVFAIFYSAGTGSNRIDGPAAALSPQAPIANSVEIRLKSPIAKSRAVTVDID